MTYKKGRINRITDNTVDYSMKWVGFDKSQTKKDWTIFYRRNETPSNARVHTKIDFLAMGERTFLI